MNHYRKPSDSKGPSPFAVVGILLLIVIVAIIIMIPTIQ